VRALGLAGEHLVSVSAEHRDGAAGDDEVAALAARDLVQRAEHVLPHRGGESELAHSVASATICDAN
jgi:hypothetical protein